MKQQPSTLSRDDAYIESVHREGRAWMLSAMAMFLLVPLSICIHTGAWPRVTDVLVGLLGVAPIFWTVSSIEVLTYVPMLGAAGSYLGFVTGNLTSLKVPCALNALDIAKVDPNTEEAEVLSTISIAISSIVTTVIIAAGVLTLRQIGGFLESPVLAPAFNNILPALMGALAVVFVSRHWKIAVAPLVCMLALFICVPSLASSVGILVPLGALISIAAARILYKRNMV